MPAGPAYRDEEAGLAETRAALVDARRADAARLVTAGTVVADRVARVAGGALALVGALVLAALDLAAPSVVAAPRGGTLAGHALALTPLLALCAWPAARALRRGVVPFVPTADVRADVARLREGVDLEPALARAARLERASLVLPLLALAAWPALAALHAALELVPLAPLRFYELMPSLALRRMGPAEALATFQAGGAVCALLSFVAYAVAVLRSAGRGFPAGKDAVTTSGLFFGGVLLGAALAQLAGASLEEGPLSVAVGYGGIALGLVLGFVGARSALASAVRLRDRERAALAGPGRAA